MNKNDQIFTSDNKGLRLTVVFLLIVLIAFSNRSYFSDLFWDMDKIETLAEGESDLDMEEKEVKKETEEASFMNAIENNIALSSSLLHDQQNTNQHKVYHLKIPTPPPDQLLF